MNGQLSIMNENRSKMLTLEPITSCVIKNFD